MKFDDQNILWQLYLESAAENMIISSLKKFGATPEHTQLFLQRDNGKMLFKPQDVPVLYDWIQNSSADTQELANDYKTYQKYFSNVPLNKFASYIDWTEKVHAKRDEASYQSRNKEIKDVDVKEQDQADVLADDEDVLILKGDSEHKCVRYGKGYSFCISRPGGGNMYGNYRMSKASTFYFIHFKKIPKEDKRHIMVLDITDKGWEWTFENNVTKEIEGGWNEVVKTFPVLAKYKSLFVNKPLTEEEKSYQKKLKKFVGNPNKDKFEEFTYQEKADVLKFGMLIKIDVFKSLDKYLRNEWISVGPKMSDDIYKLLSPKEIERFTDVRKQQLSQREPQDQFDIAIAFEDKTLYAEYILPEKELLEKEMQQYDDTRETKNSIVFNTKYFPIKLPQLQQCGDIYAHGATSIDLPQLQKSGYINASNITSIKLPQLQQSGNIFTPNATIIDLPLLQQSMDIYAHGATSIDLPQLQQSGAIYAQNADSVNLPQLQQSKSINAQNADSVNLPQLRQSRNIFTPNATIINLPQLQKSGIINADNAKKITIPSHLREKLDGVSAECEIIHPDQTQSLNDSVVYDLMKSYLLQS